tara:strand:- start:83 stop:676 length:594 start_codon:yes stop_codon:yes gene_type:complete
MATLLATTPYNNKMLSVIKTIVDDLILKVIRQKETKRILMRISSDGPVYADDRYVYYPDGTTLDLQEPNPNESDSDDEFTDSESDIEVMQSHGYALPDEKKTPEKRESLKRSRDTEQAEQETISPKRARFDSMVTNYGTDPDEMEEDAQMKLDELDDYIMLDDDIIDVFKEDIIEDYLEVDDFDDDINLMSDGEWFV